MVDWNPSLVEARDRNGMSGVAVATYNGHPEIATLLISKGAPLTLFDAAMVGDLRRAENLIGNDRKIADSYSTDGFTALHLSAFFGKTDMAKYLIKIGADVDAPSKNLSRVRPLHSGAAGGNIEICELLLSNGADINAKQEKDFTPLHAAAQSGNLKMAELFLKHGARLDAKTTDGRTPLDMAEEDSREAGPKPDRLRVAKLIKVKGAKRGHLTQSGPDHGKPQ